ncbi:hypothetical protein BVI434_500004 [Burkholderia vietnamiensis]|nr:hypothetical protein EHZ18_05355 [Burkholderia vietnamiensis]TPQ43192.1 hypothetical protein C2U71_19160 [Burkholderia ubonensis]CAG9195918.1 hypothetical protein BVI1335_1230045 [Burkholderia vietnamiensis]CAG9227476.1 hypothetical protein BVI434_500004 [Burkholderia vietnamiensis]
METAVAGARCGCVRRSGPGIERIAGRCEDAACEDRPVDTGERFFVRSARQGRTAERKAMIDRTHALPVSRQTRLVGIARSSVYYRPQPVSEVDRLLMRRIDEQHMEFPFSGARMLARLLRREGHEVGRRRVRTLMKRMGAEALCRDRKFCQLASVELLAE